mmetsp:Transcript_13535/g.24271  ORF Transcript_13535/g.24271 Transcript_13535/m.24271 type:complete len:235 (-) Transcript_13535:528-1232(-)
MEFRFRACCLRKRKDLRLRWQERELKAIASHQQQKQHSWQPQMEQYLEDDYQALLARSRAVQREKFLQMQMHQIQQRLGNSQRFLPLTRVQKKSDRKVAKVPVLLLFHPFLHLQAQTATHNKNISSSKFCNTKRREKINNRKQLPQQKLSQQETGQHLVHFRVLECFLLLHSQVRKRLVHFQLQILLLLHKETSKQNRKPRHGRIPNELVQVRAKMMPTYWCDLALKANQERAE